MTTIKTEYSDGISSVQGITACGRQAGLDLSRIRAKVAGQGKGGLMAISRNCAGETKEIGFRA